MYEDSIGIYADEACKVKLDSIEVGKDLQVKTINGEILTYKNAVGMGTEVKVEVYLKNEADTLLVIHDVSCPDERVNLRVANAKLDAKSKTLLTITIKIPENLTKEEAKSVIKMKQIRIQGYLIISDKP